MRICSLLPSATEIAFALGLGDQVVAVSHECDYPPEASNRPVLTKSAIHQKIHRSLEADREVELRGGDIYEIENNQGEEENRSGGRSAAGLLHGMAPASMGRRTLDSRDGRLRWRS